MIVNLYIDRASTQIEVKPIMDNFMQTFTTYVYDSSGSGEIMNLLNKETYPTLEEGTKIVNRVKEGFAEYLDEYCMYITGLDLSDEEKTWLKENLGVNLAREVPDQEENGNSWYWMQHSGQWFNQQESFMEEKRICQVCQKEFPRSSMSWTQDCHGIPFRLVCSKCYDKIMEENGYDGEYYTEADECIDEDYQMKEN